MFEKNDIVYFQWKGVEYKGKVSMLHSSKERFLVRFENKLTEDLKTYGRHTIEFDQEGKLTKQPKEGICLTKYSVSAPDEPAVNENNINEIDFEIGDSIDVICIKTNKVLATGVAVKGDIPPFHMTVKFENPDGTKCNWYVDDNGLSGSGTYKFKKSLLNSEIKFLKDYGIGDIVNIRRPNGDTVKGTIVSLARGGFGVKYKRNNSILNIRWFSNIYGSFLSDELTDEGDYIMAVDNLTLWERKEHIPFISTSALDTLTDNFKQNKEENKMRRTVTVELFDDDNGLEVQDSLVARFENVVTEDNDNVTIQEVIMENNIKDILDTHNIKREGTVDLSILERTGNTVMLRPVKLKDLRWVVR